jgi:GDP-L-fucose synthase
MKNIFVTGASGFLGKILCKKLEENNNVIQINSSNCNLIEYENLNQFKNEKFDEIYHLAAWTQAGDFCLYHQGEQWLINQQINTNILKWWKENQSQAKFICMGTSCAYDPDLPLMEENYLLGKPIESLFTYAMTKRMLYSGLLALNKQYGMQYLCFVPSTLYGVGYHTDGRQMHFIFDLIRKIIRGKYLNEQVVLWGDGNQKRELVLADDFVEIMLSINRSAKNDIFNIGAGKDYSIKEFATKICSIVDYNFEFIKFDTDKYVGAKSKCLNIDKIKLLLPEYKLTHFDIGIEHSINFFINNKNKILEL